MSFTTVKTKNENQLDIKYSSVEIEDVKPKNNKQKDTLYLVFSVFGAILLMVGAGAFNVWTSPAIVKLKSNNTEINPLGRPITAIEISSLMGIPYFVSVLGLLIIPILADKIGRKGCMQLIGIGTLFCVVSLAFSTNIYLMVISCTFFGIISIGIWTILPIYLIEICEDHNRSKYSCMMAGFFPLGQLFSYIVGPFLNLKNYTLILCTPIILFLLLFSFAPETPGYYASKGKETKSKKILTRLRSNKTKIEIDEDFVKIKQSFSNALSNSLGSKKEVNYFTFLRTKQARVGLILGMLPIICQTFSGMPIVMPLMAPIMNEAGLNISGNKIAMLVGFFKICCFVIASSIVEKIGKKPLLIVSSIGACLPALTLGTFFYLKHINSSLLFSAQWLPIPSVLIYIFFYSMGLGPIPFTIIPELFPTEIRSSAVSFIVLTSTFILSFFVFGYPLVAEKFGTHWCLWIFGINCLCSALFLFFFLPETRGKSIHEIQEVLKNY